MRLPARRRDDEATAPARPAAAPAVEGGEVVRRLLDVQRLAGNAAALRAAEEEPVIRRTVASKLLSKTNKVLNPAVDRPKGLYTLGYCPPVLNGQRIDESAGVQGARGHVELPKLKEKATDEGVSLTVTKVATNKVTSHQDLLVKPPWRKKKLSQDELVRATEGIDIELAGRDWTEGGSFEVVGEDGAPATLAQQVKLHEDVHAQENLEVSQAVLEPWDEELQQAKDAKQAFTGADRQEAEAALWAHAGATPDQVADRLVQDWGARSDAFHRRPEGATTVDDPQLDPGRQAVKLPIRQP